MSATPIVMVYHSVLGANVATMYGVRTRLICFRTENEPGIFEPVARGVAHRRRPLRAPCGPMRNPHESPQVRPTAARRERTIPFTSREPPAGRGLWGSLAEPEDGQSRVHRLLHFDSSMRAPIDLTSLTVEEL
jgi:hypothetical protein